MILERVLGNLKGLFKNYYSEQLENLFATLSNTSQESFYVIEDYRIKLKNITESEENLRDEVFKLQERCKNEIEKYTAMEKLKNKYEKEKLRLMAEVPHLKNRIILFEKSNAKQKILIKKLEKDISSH